MHNNNARMLVSLSIHAWTIAQMQHARQKVTGNNTTAVDLPDSQGQNPTCVEKKRE